ncbi:MAG: hypothetical protein IT450_17790 [Phycisphaerales bacterium]|nr:hypothetical protein [Phycisphaerales bacterium]
MRRVLLCLVPFMLLATLGFADPISLRVLYAGKPGSEREARITAFLQKHFTRVGKASLTEFKPADAADYDVVIFDWTPMAPEGRILPQPELPELDESYDRATVMVGHVGGSLGGQQHLKLDWL